MHRRDIIKYACYAGAALIASPVIACGKERELKLVETPEQKNFNLQNKEMLKRQIPSSGEMLPVIGLGSWLQFDVDDAEEKRSPLKEVLLSMKELGGKVIDSSPMYGRSEKVIGELTTELSISDDFFYATKVWVTGEQKGIDQMEESLKLLKRPYIDLMQVHNLVDWKTHLKTMKKWKEENKIRYTGITHYTENFHADLEDIINNEKIDFVQFNYNIGERNAEKSLLDTALDRGVSVIINEPYEKGSFFQKVKNVQLPPWASDYDINSWGQYFLKYIISHPAVTCVIPGTSNPKHLQDNMQAGYGRLPDEAGRRKMAEFFSKL